MIRRVRSPTYERRAELVARAWSRETMYSADEIGSVIWRFGVRLAKVAVRHAPALGRSPWELAARIYRAGTGHEP